MSETDNPGVAGRIRGLLSGQGTVSELAARLRVDETALRMSIDDISPYPTMDVILAVVRDYGIDPNWLLTGEYDSATHQAAIEAGPEEMSKVMNDVVRRVTGTAITPRNLRIIR